VVTTSDDRSQVHRRSAEGAGRAILRMANDARVDVELRTYVQIEKYISGPKTDAATPSLKRILLDRKDENRERKTRILAQLADLLSRGDFYALGQKLALKPQGPSVILDEALNYLVSNTYSKLGYIKVRQADPAAEIRAVLASDTHGQYKIALDGEDGNAWPSARCASTSPLRPAPAACCCPTWWTALPVRRGAGGPSWKRCC
jgi:hypothetical protein